MIVIWYAGPSHITGQNWGTRTIRMTQTMVHNVGNRITDCAIESRLETIGKSTGKRDEPICTSWSFRPKIVFHGQTQSDCGLLTPPADQLTSRDRCRYENEIRQRLESRPWLSSTIHVSRDLQEEGIIYVKYCPADTTVADTMTKAVLLDRLGNRADSRQIKF
jgi:hypothetical protein